ncbi:MAG TPA: hypothetical protein VFG10_17595 [Saprospiraceae bacterium]|nr:hypothetical protein [Saprospiraceae bacterium]
MKKSIFVLFMLGITLISNTAISQTLTPKDMLLVVKQLNVGTASLMSDGSINGQFGETQTSILPTGTIILYQSNISESESLIKVIKKINDDNSNSSFYAVKLEDLYDNTIQGKGVYNTIEDIFLGTLSLTSSGEENAQFGSEQLFLLKKGSQIKYIKSLSGEETVIKVIKANSGSRAVKSTNYAMKIKDFNSKNLKFNQSILRKLSNYPYVLDVSNSEFKLPIRTSQYTNLLQNVSAYGKLVFAKNKYKLSFNDFTLIADIENQLEVEFRGDFKPSTSQGLLSYKIENISLELGDRIPITYIDNKTLRSYSGELKTSINMSKIKDQRLVNIIAVPNIGKSLLGRIRKSNLVSDSTLNSRFYPAKITIDSLIVNAKANSNDKATSQIVLKNGQFALDSFIHINNLDINIRVNNFVDTYDRLLIDRDFINGQNNAFFRANTTINAVSGSSLGLGSMFNVGRDGRNYSAHHDFRVDYWLHFNLIDNRTGIRVVPDITNVHGIPGEIEQAMKSELFNQFMTVAKFATFGPFGFFLKNKKAEKKEMQFSLSAISNDLRFTDVNFTKLYQKGISFNASIIGKIPLTVSAKKAMNETSQDAELIEVGRRLERSMGGNARVLIHRIPK